MNNVHQATQEFLASVQATKAATLFLQQSKPTKTDTCSTATESFSSYDDVIIKMLAQLAVLVPPQLTELYEQAGLNRTRGSRLIKKIVRTGLGVEHLYHPSRRGGAIKLIEITEQGWQLLCGMNIHPHKKVLQGSWNHDLCGKVLGAIGKRLQYHVDYEAPIGKGNVRIDVVWRSKDGKQIFIQCGVSSPEREVQSIIKAMDIPIIKSNRLILVCLDKKFSGRVNTLLKQYEDQPALNKVLSVKLFGDVLETYYNKQTNLDLNKP